jgi:hypothetical protein
MGRKCDGDDADLCEDDAYVCADAALLCSRSVDDEDLCDGSDNDCDPRTEDGAGDPRLGWPCDGDDSDLCMDDVYLACAQGRLLCASGPDDLEVCDGFDNDCNSRTLDGDDDPALGGACDGDDGDLCFDDVFAQCMDGVLRCTSGLGEVDACDGTDDDCDPASADGAEDPLMGAPCDGDDADLCLDDVYGGCLGGVMQCGGGDDDLDVCNDADDDCDPASLDGSEDVRLGGPCDGDDTDLCEDDRHDGCLLGALTCSIGTDDLDVCDGVDNDCSPATPDGDKDPLVRLGCDGADADRCEEGALACVGAQLVCSDDTGDVIEACNGVDDDCDGVLPPDERDADGDGYGVCAGDCDDLPAGCGAACSPGAGEKYAAAPERCRDGLDNDCDGDTDNADVECWMAPSCDERLLMTFVNASRPALADFVTLVTLTSDRAGVTRTGPGDLRFHDSDGTLLLHEVDQWAPAATSWVWVRIPQVDSSDADAFWMYYDCSTQENPEASSLWTDYAGVWHLGPDLADSTEHGSDGLDAGSKNETGVVGPARKFGRGDYISLGGASHLQIRGDLTVSVWVRLTHLDDGVWENVLVSCGGFADGAAENFPYAVNVLPDARLQSFWEYGEGEDVYLASSAASEVASLQWHFVTLTRDSTVRVTRFYVDGVLVGGSIPYSEDPTGGTNVGLYLGTDACCPASNSYKLRGALDEVRIEARARSAAWVEAQHATMTDRLITYGTPERR